MEASGLHAELSVISSRLIFRAIGEYSVGDGVEVWQGLIRVVEVDQ